MSEYSFITIPLVRRRPGISLKEDYREVIREQAAAGWEFVQAITFENDAQPHIDLVFVRKASS